MNSSFDEKAELPSGIPISLEPPAVFDALTEAGGTAVADVALGNPPPGTPPPKAAPYGKVTFPQRVGLGAGGICDLGMQYAILNLALGVNPVIIGIAMALPRFWEMLIDPWIGGLSDRTRGRLGRRHPYIRAGGVLGGLIFAAIWWVPGSWPVTAKGIWLIGFALLHFTAFSFFMVPYSALLGEVTSDSVERIKVMAMRTAFTVICSAGIAWLYWLCQRPFFGGPVQGMRIVGIGFGLIMALASLWPTLVCKKSRAFHSSDATVPKHENEWLIVKELLKESDFRAVLYAVLGLLGSFTLVSNLGFYISVYFMYHGNTDAASKLNGISGTIGLPLGIATCALVGTVVKKLGEWTTLMVCMTLAFLGQVGVWWSARPEWPYATILTGVFVGLGVTAFWIFMPSLTGRISNLYELRTGKSYYGSFFALYNVTMKIAGSVSLLLTGVVLNYTGFDVTRGQNQLPGTILEMRKLYVFIPSVGVLIALAFLRKAWPKTEPVPQPIAN
jgi:GPH family glycoside/pentoside/hexuronide:cation symporter